MPDREGELEGGGVLMGYRGEAIIDNGYFYTPYVPLVLTPIIFDAEELERCRIIREENDIFKFDWKKEGF